ncbi:MAG: hypothetical protein ACJ72N_00655 [Labedaea sp.]
MFGRRAHHPILDLLRQPGAGWLLLATAYLSSAIVSVYLALNMSVWWPLALVAGSLVGAALCVTAAIRNARQPKPVRYEEPADDLPRATPQRLSRNY